MAIFSAGNLILTTAAGAACLEIVAPTKKRIFVYELSVTLETALATTSELGFGVPAVSGIGPTLIYSTNEDAGGLSDTFPVIAVAWATPPQAPAAFFRTGILDQVVGRTLCWMFPHGLEIPAGGSLVVWNISQIESLDVNMVWDF